MSAEQRQEKVLELQSGEGFPVLSQDNLAVAQYDRDLSKMHRKLTITRLDGTIAVFGEVTNKGFDGATNQVRPAVEEAIMAPSRELLKQEVTLIEELDRLFVPGSERLERIHTSAGDWEPAETYVRPEDLIIQGLQKQYQPETDGVEDIMEVIKRLHTAGTYARLQYDPALAVSLESVASGWKTAAKLMSFAEVTDTTPQGEEFSRAVVVVRDNAGNVGLQPPGTCVTGLFIKHPDEPSTLPQYEPEYDQIPF